MERPLNAAENVSRGNAAPEKGPRKKSPHLMCGTRFWGVVAAAVSAYLAYLSYSQVREGDFYWQHEWWTILTWAVWLTLIAGLLTETQCWRERILFSLVLINFALGFIFAAWASAPSSVIRQAREAAVGLWTLAAIASLTTLSRRTQASI